MNRTEILEIAKPILFNTEMVNAISEGRKTVTRRVIKVENANIWEAKNNLYEESKYGATVPCYLVKKEGHANEQRGIYYPKYDIGDYLYVRETHTTLGELDGNDQPIDGTVKTYYKADNTSLPFNEFLRDDGSKKEYPAWTPSIHMPKEAARLFLNVTEVRVEQIKDITEEQVAKEGFNSLFDFVKTVTQIYPDANGDTWVWVYEFERVEVK